MAPTSRRERYPTLTLAERDRRWRELRDLARRSGLEGLVVFGKGRDLADSYITNERKRAVVLLTLDDDPVMFPGDVPLERYDAQGARWERWVKDWIAGDPITCLRNRLQERELTSARLGIVGLTGRFVGESDGSIPYSTWIRVLAELPNVQWIDVAAEYESLAIIKSPEEQTLLRTAAAIGEQACNAFVEAAKSGANEHEIVAAAQYAIFANGGWTRSPFMLERAGSSMFAWAVPEWFEMGGAPHRPTKGDTIAAEIFAFYGGQESQQQIDVVVGEPSQLLCELEQICLQSYAAGLAALRPGVMFSELAAIMEEPLTRSRAWNTGPMVQTVSPIYNSATRINPGVDPALTILPELPHGVPRDGDFMIQEGHAFAFEPNALRDGQRVCIGGTVLLSSAGVETLNHLPNRLIII